MDGGSLATLLFKAFEKTMKPRRTRKQLTDEERQSLWEAQSSVRKPCGCTGAPKEREIDHVVPLCVGGGDTLDNLQILCKACHAQMTQLETLSFVEESNQPPSLSILRGNRQGLCPKSEAPPARCKSPRKKGRSDLNRR